MKSDRIISGCVDELLRVGPDRAIEEIQRTLAERHLRNFVELAWPIIEPQRQFVPGWHIDAICDHLEAVTAGHINRLLINIPPGCMKSLLTNVLWPAWEWGPKGLPNLRYIGASYSDKLTIRDNRRTRNIIISNWYQRLWGKRFHLMEDQNAKTRFDNDHTGFKIATSVGGLGVGERGDRFVIDDANKILESESDAERGKVEMWFLETVPTRVTDPEKSAIIAIQQRTHEGDVSGIILSRNLDYVHLCLPMEFEPDRKCFVEITGFEDPRTNENELLWPQRMTRAVVERDKLTLGSYATAGQFQQRPAPRGGGMFKRKWWRFYKTDQPGRPSDCNEFEPDVLPAKFDRILTSVDAAFKATATGSRVGMLLVAQKGPFYYVLKNLTRPMTFTETKANIREIRVDHPLALQVLVEDKANGPAIVDSLRLELPGVIEINPEGGKEARASAIEPIVESGHVLLPEGATWLDSFISEFAQFPAGNHDDQVDALSQALIYMRGKTDVARAIMLAKW